MRPALHVKVTLEELKVDFGTGLSIWAAPLGVGDGVGVAEGFGVRVGAGVGVAVGLGVGVGVGFGVEDGVGVGVADDFGVAVGVGEEGGTE